MSRRKWSLWGAAAVIAVLPDAFLGIHSLLTGDDGSRVYTWMSTGSCPGHEISKLIRYPDVIPLLWYGGAPMIAVAFLCRHLCVRSGRERLGRNLARAGAVILLLDHLPGPLLLALDGALGGGCLAAWGPPETVSWNAGMGLYLLVPPILVLLAVRPARERFVRSGPVVRTAGAAVTLTAALVLLNQATPAGKVSGDMALDCAGAGGGSVRDLTEAEKDFLCQVRGFGPLRTGGGVEGWAGVPDRVVLTQGRDLCRLAERHGGDTGAPAVRDAPQSGLARVLGPLCPAVSRAQEQAGEREQEEEDAYVAEKEAACAKHPAHRPRISPVRQHRATMWTEFWTLNGWDDGYEGTAPDMVRELVGGTRGGLTIWAADEFGHACVTTESYTRRPPVETKGWKEVVEVAYESPGGSLTLVDGRGNRSPKLTAVGPGSYRVRVHLRGRELVYQVADRPDGAVELLIMVFPGEQKKLAVYR
ncbi:hypothetical protein [Nonomuraea typhae]|uniref:Uncharacterized protein n=1 Tax=Nonomuraea typhae TaxID=2603600 RepID=A0ABW7YK02_9ACTN